MNKYYVNDFNLAICAKSCGCLDNFCATNENITHEPRKPSKLKNARRE